MERTTAIIMGLLTIVILAIVGKALMGVATHSFSDLNQPSAIVSIFEDPQDSTITFPK